MSSLGQVVRFVPRQSELFLLVVDLHSRDEVHTSQSKAFRSRERGTKRGRRGREKGVGRREADLLLQSCKIERATASQQIFSQPQTRREMVVLTLTLLLPNFVNLLEFSYLSLKLL